MSHFFSVDTCEVGEVHVVHEALAVCMSILFSVVDAVVLRDELAVRVQLPGQVVCVLVHHYQIPTEVERSPHRERVAVHNEEYTELALLAFQAHS